MSFYSIATTGRLRLRSCPHPVGLCLLQRLLFPQFPLSTYDWAWCLFEAVTQVFEKGVDMENERKDRGGNENITSNQAGNNHHYTSLTFTVTLYLFKISKAWNKRFKCSSKRSHIKDHERSWWFEAASLWHRMSFDTCHCCLCEFYGWVWWQSDTWMCKRWFTEVMMGESDLSQSWPTGGLFGAISSYVLAKFFSSYLSLSFCARLWRRLSVWGVFVSH